MIIAEFGVWLPLGKDRNKIREAMKGVQCQISELLIFNIEGIVGEC